MSEDIQQAESTTQPAEQAPPKSLSDAFKQAEKSAPAARPVSYEEKVKLEQELHAAREQLKQAEGRVDPSELKQRLRENPKDFLTEAGVDLNSVLDIYLGESAEQVQAEQPEPVDEVSDDPIARKVKELEAKLAAREQQELESRELSAIGAKLSEIEAPALKHLASQGQPVGKMILDAVLGEYQRTGKVVPYEQAIKALESQQKAYFEQLARAYGATVGSSSAEDPKQSATSQASATLTNRLNADPPNERREAASLNDRKRLMVEAFKKAGF